MCITERADHQWLVTKEEIWDEKDTNEQDLNAFIFPTFVHGHSHGRCCQPTNQYTGAEDTELGEWKEKQQWQQGLQF